MASSDHKGFTDHEILVEVRDLMKDHLDQYNEDRVLIAEDFQRRPTRGEVVSWFGGLLAATGIAVALLSL